MKRRFLLVALAVALLVAVFVAAKIASSWRPVAIGPLLGDRGAVTIPYLSASSNVVFAGDENATVTRFDLSSGSRAKRAIEGFCQGGGARWRLRDAATPQLEIIRFNQTRAYPLSALMARKLKQASRSNLVDGGVFLSAVRVLDGPEQVQLLVGERFCRWSQRTGKLEREFAYIEFDAGNSSALSRDGQSIVRASYEVATYSTRDGHLIKQLQWAAKKGGQQQTSPFGTYSIYRGSLANREQWIMIDTRTGRRLWNVDWDAKRDLVFFSPDETWLVIGRPSLGVWHLHRTRDGVMTHTLPLLPNAVAAAFSPDNATLYSVADGVLYQQRVR